MDSFLAEPYQSRTTFVLSPFIKGESTNVVPMWYSPNIVGECLQDITLYSRFLNKHEFHR